MTFSEDLQPELWDCEFFSPADLAEENFSQPIVIVGAGGFGRHVLAVLRTMQQWREDCFLGFLDDGQVRHDRLERLGVAHLGGTDYCVELPKDTRYVLGIGNGAVREKLVKKFLAAGLKPLTLVHHQAWVAPDARIGEGSIICPGARVDTNVVLGRGVHINNNDTIGHDAILADWVTVFPMVAVAGEVHIGQRSTIGAGSCINPGQKLGADVYVGAGAAVVSDVPDSTLVVGVPAKPRG